MATAYVETEARRQRTEAEAREDKASQLEQIADELEDELEGVMDLECQLKVSFKIGDLRARASRLRNAALFGKVTGR